MMYLKIAIVFISLISFTSVVHSQTLKSELQKEFTYSQLEEYISPLSQAFGANLSSGIYYSAGSHSFPHFDIGISYSSTNIPSGKFSQKDSLNSPTVFGNVIDDSSRLSGLNISDLSFPVLQFSIGIGDNTNFIVRYTNWKINKIGNAKLFGGGIKYELENLLSISPIPMNVAILAIYQKYQIDDILEGAVFTMNIIGSKDIGIIPLGIYGGAGYLNNTTNVNKPDGSDEESYSIDGLEEVKYQIGVSYSLMFLRLNVEYNFGQYNSFNGGIRIVL